jgi:hypothetical protein
MTDAEITSSTVDGKMRVQVHGPNGPYSGFSVEKNRKRFSLPSGTILYGLPRDKFVAWNGTGYELHHSAERILCDDSLLLIGQAKELSSQTNSVIPHQAPPPPRSTRMPSTVHSPAAARKIDAFLAATGLDQTEFAIQANTTDKTIRKIRRTARIKRSMLNDIAKALGITREELLKDS